MASTSVLCIVVFVLLVRGSIAFYFRCYRVMLTFIVNRASASYALLTTGYGSRLPFKDPPIQELVLYTICTSTRTSHFD
jgi:hypothetical protein